MSTSKKRKFGDMATKYYAVRAGHNPGVYLNWQDCKDNITHFKGAQFKSFTTQQDAEDFVAGRVTAAMSASSKSQGDKFYAVAVGRIPGIYENWDAASQQIKDWKGPKYKKFGTRAEAEEFVRTGGKSTKEPEVASQSPAKKKKTAAASSTKKQHIRVYTDGSSLGNGRHGALAGVGVFFGEGDPRNVSEALQGDMQTNQRAELTAVIRALEKIPKDRDMRIITDSKYSINCATVWYSNWQKNGWKTSVGGPVLNQDLVLLIRSLIDERTARGAKTDFEWVKGHSNDPGNVAADRLAVYGASTQRY